MDKLVIANALAVTSAVAWIVCSAFVWLLPDLSMTITGWWAYGLNLTPLGAFRLDLTTFILGGITLTLAFWALGYLFGWSWEKASGK